ncbi:MAG: alpha-hydroxy acid oxidase [Rhizobiaceae bacterium]
MDLDKLIDRFPSVSYLEEQAPRSIPHFAWEYLASGTGLETGVALNCQALQQVRFIPRLMQDRARPDLAVTVLGKRFAAPIGMAPIGLGGAMWPGAERILAATARRFDIPYCLSTVACDTPEAIGSVAGDNGWFQLYTLKDKQIELDIVERAWNSGFKVLMVTVDVPENSTRERQRKAGMRGSAGSSASRLMQVLERPQWAMAAARNGAPGFRTLEKYAGSKSLQAQSVFLGGQNLGEISFEHLKVLRERWKGKLVIKGLMHGDDAQKAIEIGADGIVVSNHGARQSDGTLASIDVLQSISRAVDGRIAVIFDSGIRTGLDVMRALALGADMVLCGRAFMFGVAALGEQGGDVTAKILIDDLENNMIQIGASKAGELAGMLAARN